MFDDIIQYVNDEYRRLSQQRPNSGISYEALLEKYKEKVFAKKEVVRHNIRTLEQKDTSLVKDLVASVKGNKELGKILVKHANRAIQMNKEFNLTIFKQGLIEACMDPRSIRLMTDGRLVHVEIDLNTTAGSINDYARAVEKVRKMLASQKRKGSGPGRPYVESKEPMASLFWKKIYRTAREGGEFYRRKFNRKAKVYERRDVTAEVTEKYWWTMKARLDYAGKKAPFWEILDKGSPAMPGKGGEEYPSATPTRFTDKASLEIQALLGNKLQKQYKAIDTQLENLYKDYNKLITAYESLIEEIGRIRDRDYGIVYSDQPVKPSPSPAEIKIMALIRQREAELGVTADPGKLELLLDALRREDISGISITVEGRYELTPARSPVRFRISISSILSEFGL